MGGKQSSFTIILSALIGVCVVILVIGLVIWEQQNTRYIGQLQSYKRIEGQLERRRNSRNSCRRRNGNSKRSTTPWIASIKIWWTTAISRRT